MSSSSQFGRYPWENMWRGVLFWCLVFLAHWYWKQWWRKRGALEPHPDQAVTPPEGGLETILKQQADPNVKIGGKTDNYSWEQTETVVEISLPVRPSTTKKDVNISFKPKRLLVQFNGGSPIIDGELCREILPDECTWMFDTNSDHSRCVVLTLLKKYQTEANQHWNCVVRGHETIDVSKLGPKVVTFDPSTDDVKNLVAGLRKRRARHSTS